MNWGAIQIEALKKMFLNNDRLEVSKLEEYKTDKKYKTYLDAMPQACNEAINYICENGKPLLKEYKLKAKDINFKYKLNQVVPNFKRIYQIVYDGVSNPEWYVEGNNILVVKDWTDGDIIIYYEAYHDFINERTTSSSIIELDNYSLTLIPLYIAAELYKDDDVQLSTMYMNEFVTNVSNMKNKDFNPNPRQIESVYGMEW